MHESNASQGIPDSIKSSPLFAIEQRGKFKTKSTKEIRNSPIGIGFETLDRKLFDPEKVYPHLASLGAKWARVQTGWNRCETVRGSYDFSWLDGIVDALRAEGVEPWFNLGYGNKLYMPDSPHESAVGRVPIYYGDETREAWRRFVDALAAHFRGRIKYWEIWNEPNITPFWVPGEPSASDYVEFVRLTQPVIRKRIPDAAIIGFGLSGCHPEYVAEALEAGLGEYLDIVSYHPYRIVPEWDYQTEMETLKMLLAKYAPHVALWQGENGFAATQHGGLPSWSLFNVTEEIQGKWALRRIVSDLIQGAKHSSYFHIVDLVAEYRTSSGQVRNPLIMGLLRGVEYTERPAYHAVRNLSTLLQDFDGRKNGIVRVKRPENTSRFESALPWVSACAGGFQKRGYPLAFWYTPEELQIESAAKAADLDLWIPDLAQIQNPVIVDPLSGELYRPERCQLARSGMLTMKSVPLLDYPLFVTDEGALD